jgi:drug/metabolite transporter (DMT)-like permease
MEFPMPTQPTLANWIGLCALGLIWGASFLGVALALDGFGPVTIAAGRIALGALTLALVALVARIPLPRDGTIWAFTGAMAILSNAVPFFLLSWSQQHVTSGFAGITMAAIPLFVIGLAHVFVQGEQLSRHKAIGFVFGLIGVAVLIGPGAFRATGSALETVARFGCLAASLSYALGAIVTRRCPPVHPVAFGVLALGLASAIMVPLAVLVEGVPDPAPSLKAWGALVYLGLLPTGLATLILVGIIRSAGPSFLAQVNYHVPVWSVILGVLVLSEELPGRFILALVIIIGGLMYSRRKPIQARAAT